MNKIDKELLEQISNLHGVPQGSFNIRKNGQALKRKSTSEIEILPKPDKSGIDIIVKPNVKNRSVHIPVIITVGGFNDLVYNDFYIGENAEVSIIAGCGIHNSANETSQHDGVHSFHLEKGCKVKYIEKHLGLGKEGAGKILNPTTNIVMEESSEFEMETYQLGGVTYSNRITKAKIKDNAKLLVTEKILTTNTQTAITHFTANLVGKNASVNIVSRSVAKDNSKQKFISNVIGNNECFGHVECDGIILNNAVIESTPKIVAKDVNASLVHEAAIGKIAGEQITKLMTLGLNKDEAEELIIKGFLK